MNLSMISSEESSITGTSAFPISTLTTRTPFFAMPLRTSPAVAATFTSETPAPTANFARSALLEVQVG